VFGVEGFGGWGLGLRVYGLRSRVWGLGMRDLDAAGGAGTARGAPTLLQGSWTLVSLTSRRKDLLRPVTRVKKKRRIDLDAAGGAGGTGVAPLD